MDEVVATNSKSVTVAHRHQYFQVRLTQFDSRGKGESPSMQGMQGVKIDIAGDSGRTADTRGHDNLVFI